MSLAFYAAPINSNNDNNDNSGNSSVIDRKRNARASHNKTVKRYSGSDDKIEIILSMIKGKSKGKGKRGKGSKGKGVVQGNCRWCGKYGHSEKYCRDKDK